MKEIKAPQRVPIIKKARYLFLAGSIEMGKATQWQERVKNYFHGNGFKNLIILNPRRDNWDNSWVQSIENDQFREQVEWELNGIEMSDGVVVYFDKETKSPITLLELGLLAKTRKQVWVFCPDGFYRKGNVEIVCKKYGMELWENFDEMIKNIKEYFSG